jgi:hypothetical protein
VAFTQRFAAPQPIIDAVLNSATRKTSTQNMRRHFPVLGDSSMRDC